MKLQNVISIVNVWEKKVFEKLPIKTILAIYLIVVLCQLNAIQSKVSSIEFDVFRLEAHFRGNTYSEMSKEEVERYGTNTYKRVVAFEVMNEIVGISKVREPLRFFDERTYQELIETERRGYPPPEIRLIGVPPKYTRRWFGNELLLVSEESAKLMGLENAWNKATKIKRY